MGRTVLVLAVFAAILLNPAPQARAAAAASCAAVPAELGRFQAAKAGATLPETAFVAADGRETPLASLRGGALVINFWATWCAPCVKEMPALDRLAERAPMSGVRVVALSADREGAGVVGKFYEVNGIAHLPVALDRLGRVARSLGVTGLPTTVLFDAGGREVGRVVGIAEWDAEPVVQFLTGCLASGA